MELERAQLRETVKALKADAELEEASHTRDLEQLRSGHERALLELQAVLGSKEAQLVETTDRLTDAQIAIQERQFVALSHQRAEHALSVHAEQLSAELEACTRDVAGLFARLDEVALLQGADRGAMKGVQALVQQRMEHLAEVMATALGEQASQVSAVAAGLADLKRRKDEDVALLREQLGAMLREVRGVQDALLDQLERSQQSYVGAVGGLGEQCAAHVAAASTASAALHAAAGSAVEQLVAALDEQAGALQALVGQQAARAGAALRGMQGLMDRAQGQLSGRLGGGGVRDQLSDMLEWCACMCGACMCVCMHACVCMCVWFMHTCMGVPIRQGL